MSVVTYVSLIPCKIHLSSHYVEQSLHRGICGVINRSFPFRYCEQNSLSTETISSKEQIDSSIRSTKLQHSLFFLLFRLAKQSLPSHLVPPSWERQQEEPPCIPLCLGSEIWKAQRKGQFEETDSLITRRRIAPTMFLSALSIKH